MKVSEKYYTLRSDVLWSVGSTPAAAVFRAIVIDGNNLKQ
jgi:hypothetical protein